MKRTLRYSIISFVLILIFTNCASTIKTTGAFQLEPKTYKINLICNTPESIDKFSNRLCTSLKINMERLGHTVTTKVIDNMTPSIESDSVSNTVSKETDIIIKINYIEIFLYGGMPCGTLMNVAMFQNKMSQPIWVARVKTEGSNITGPGNPEKVSIEIINQLKLDGFK